MKGQASLLADAETLRWAGALGHTFVVVVDRDGGERGAAFETCDRKSAVNRATGEYARQNPRIYSQYRAGKWREVKSAKARAAAAGPAK